MTQLVMFLAGSIPLLVLSRASLRLPGSHGFYRFFAWESILGLLVHNIGGWFRDPLSAPQLVSWLLLGISALLVLHALIMLRRYGGVGHERNGRGLIGVERTTRLVKRGIYRYIRHPLYSSLLWLAWGAFLKSPSWLGGLLALSATGSLLATARTEEMENLRLFGEAYREYMRRTKMFVPFLI